MRLHRMSMLAAGGVGYVLGAKAGRERYEQIRHAMHEAPHASEMAKEKVMAAADKVRQTVENGPGSMMHKTESSDPVDSFTSTDPVGPFDAPEPPLTDTSLADTSLSDTSKEPKTW